MKMKKQLVLLGIIFAVLTGAVAIFMLTNQNPGEDETVSTAESLVDRSEPAMVTIEGDGVFIPATLNIKTGTTVTWTSNDDDLNHQLVSGPHPDHSDEPNLSSEILGAGSTYTYTFTRAGVYTYHDELHPELGGTIIVE